MGVSDVQTRRIDETHVVIHISMMQEPVPHPIHMPLRDWYSCSFPNIDISLIWHQLYVAAAHT